MNIDKQIRTLKTQIFVYQMIMGLTIGGLVTAGFFVIAEFILGL